MRKVELAKWKIQYYVQKNMFFVQILIIVGNIEQGPNFIFELSLSSLLKHGFNMWIGFLSPLQNLLITGVIDKSK